jgi:glutamate:GABA antiporter
MSDVAAGIVVPATPKLKFLDTVLYALAVGTGLRWIAVAAAVGPSSLPLWLIALLTFFVPLAVATAELTARFGGEGGIYQWVRDTYGPLAGFICGWFYWIALMPYFAGILYFLGGLALAAIGADPKDTPLYLAISLGVTALVTAVQGAGLAYGKWLPNFGTAGGWIVFFTIVAVAVALGLEGRGATDFARASYVPPATFDTVILWGTIVFAFSGVESLAFLRNEVEGVMRTFVWALAIVGVGTTILYLLGTLSFLVILPKAELTRLAGFPDALRIGLARVGLPHLAAPVIALFALAMLGGLTSWFGVGARLPFAAGIDAFLPKIFAWRHPRNGAPLPAILLQSALMLVFVFLSQAGTSVASAYDFLVAMSVLTTTIPYVFMFAVYLKCAKLKPMEGAWSPPGGVRTSILLGWIGLISTVIAIVCSVVPNEGEAWPLGDFLKIVGATLAVTVVGLFLYWLGIRKRAVTAMAAN